MQDTSIEWADWTWGPIRGCSRISPGCQHCYAEALAARHSVASAKRPNPPFAGFAEFRIIGGRKEAHWTDKVELVESKLLEPRSWRRKALKFAEKHGRKPRAFISMSDLFHEALPFHRIDEVFDTMRRCEWINFMILTKRAARMYEYFDSTGNRREYLEQCPWIALGVSVESQKYADERIPHLLRTPAAMRFVSYEPALEAVNFRRITWHGYSHYDALNAGFDNNMERLPHLDMIIVGGESGPGARPFDIAWARSTVKQCRASGVAPYVKQMGSKPVTMMSINAALELHRFAGRNPDKLEPLSFRERKGEDMSEWPEDVRVREWPEVWN